MRHFYFDSRLRFTLILLGVLALLPSVSSSVQAQEQEPVAAEVLSDDDGGVALNDAVADSYLGVDEMLARRLRVRQPKINPDSIQSSLFFTDWQYTLLKEAKIGFFSRPVSDDELLSQVDMQDIPKEERPRGIRELALGGIVYIKQNDWIVWLNGQRLTPNALPEQVIDIRVSQDRVDLKWFDAYNNLIYPVRIRPHQRFNLDSRMFLPGTL